MVHPRQFSHCNYPFLLTTSVALCHLNNNRVALLQPGASLIACVMWRLLMSKAFFYESVIRNGSGGLLEEGATELGCTKETRLCSIKESESLTVGIYQFNDWGPYELHAASRSGKTDLYSLDRSQSQWDAAL